MPRLPISAAAVAVALLGGCASSMESGGFGDKLLGLVTPYKIDIIQGNVVTQEQLERVQLGMTRRQVRDLLGTPLLADVFHDSRWDYPFAIRRQGAEPQRRNITLQFEGDKLVKLDAPALPTEREFVASIAPKRDFPERKLELTDAEREALPVPAKVDSPEPEPVGPVRSYPPLERP